MNHNVLKAEYAVRGKLVIMAEEYQEQLQAGKKLPFDAITFCNIGNPQAVGQAPLTFPRQVFSLCINPSLLEEGNLQHTRKLYPADTIDRAQQALKHTPGGFGAYSHSKGVSWVRDSVCRYIEERDGGVPANPEHVFLTNGASQGIAQLMDMIVRDSNDGVMIPIPQYPLYSATAALLGAAQIPYYLNENKGWGFEVESLRASIAKARANGVTPRAMVVINPGNPTGQVLSEDDIKNAIRVCKEEKMIIMADEVYQNNVYGAKPFHSFKKVLHSMGPDYIDTELLSFNSTSKGFLGECGFRGGYMECHGMHPDVLDQIYKLMSIGLCSNLPGQLMTDLMVRPPIEGDPSFPLYKQERDSILVSLASRAKKCAAVFNTLEGMSCNDAEGAMYLFPRFTVPSHAAAAAKEAGMLPDVHYCSRLLEETGICVVPGSGFGQEEGTWHFRTTFLPSEAQIDGMIERMRVFHHSYMNPQ